MAKQLNVSLNIDAQTSKAKSALNELNKILTDIQTNRTITVNDKSLQEAKQAASDLKFHLAQATSVDTGKLNLGAFSQSLKKAGQDLNTLYGKLSVIGPEGQKAFLALSQSIVQADHASLTLGNRLAQLGTTLKNTARWQLSSSLLHGFMGALQGAYGYAQDLNKSLNNIRIVTGQSIDQMAKFADEANRAAKELSTTTTRYTDAALIYYQQGLTGKAVTDRVEATVKLANVSRQSAEEVSSQMTAIWNNFDDGSKKLEYYADVITALGAATASSSDEIAQGLQKFAAVADTVGLSYEKATAALATVVAETRQSADVVGTAFKTMFARFQGVTLGETLEDGVGLNKYSKALATVGVDILEANGNLKDMDTILDELGEKWNQIGNAQQVALAETVAGTRQYAQFMAIMENYDKILANQNLAEGSEGTLEQQAKIYAESWEAARDRVKTALQGIYSQLLDDNAFIAGLNGLEKFIDAIGGAIKGLGGLKTILLMVGSIVASKYANEMPNIIQKLTGNFSVLTGAAEKHRIAMIQDADAIIQQMNAADAGTKGFQAQIGAMQIVSKMTAELEAQKKNLSKTEIASYQQKIQEAQIYGQAATAIGQEIDALNKLKNTQQQSMRSQLFRSGNLSAKYELAPDEQKRMAQIQSELMQAENSLAAHEGSNRPSDQQKVVQATARIKALNEELKQLQLVSGKTGSQLIKDFSSISEKAGQMKSAYNTTLDRAKAWQQTLSSSSVDIEKTKTEMLAYADVMEKSGINVDELKTKIKDASSTSQLQEALDLIVDDMGKIARSTYEADEKVEILKAALLNMGIPQAELDALEETMRKSGASSQEYAAALETLKQKYQGLKPHAISTSEALSRLGSAAMAVSSAFNAIKNIGSIWNDEDVSTGEKILQTLMSLGMLLPAINTLLDKQTLSAIAASFSLKGLAVAQTANTAATTAATGATIAFGTALKALPIGWVITILGVLAGIIALIAKEIETPAEKLKRLRQEEEELIEVTEKAKNEWKEFTNTISQYDEALEGLKKLTAGTTEFNEQLQQSNALARSLISSLSLEFLKDFIYDANGVIVFTEQGRNRINEAQTQGLKAQSSLDFQVAQAKERTRKAEYEANSRYEYNDTERSLIYENNRSEYAGQWKPNDLEYDIIHGMVASFMNEFTDENGKIQKTGYGAFTDQERQELIAGVQGRYNSQSEEEITHLVDYMLEKLESEYQSFGADYVPNYNEQKTIIAGQLDSKNPFANAVANALFSDANIVDNTENQILSDLKDKGILTDTQAKTELDKIFDYLDEDTLNDMIEKAGSSMKLLVSSMTTQNLIEQAQEMLDSIGEDTKVFTKDNKDLLVKILTNNIQDISPEDMQNFSLSDEEKKKFAEMYEKLYGESISNIDQYFEDFKNKTYDPAKFYKNQIQGVQSVQESIKNLNKELGSLKLGDTIDSQVYTTLSEDMQAYFQMMEDGTYKLVGDAEKFQDTLFGSKAQIFETELTKYQNLANTQQKNVFAPTERNGVQSEDYIGSVTRGLYQQERQDYEDTAIAYAMSADSLEQLNYVTERFNELGIAQKIQTKALDASLQELATKYDSCTEELELFQRALISGDENAIRSARDTLRLSTTVAELAKSTGLEASELESQSKRVSKYISSEYQDIKNITKASSDWAVANQRLSRGINNLSKNLEDNKKILSESQVTTVEYTEAMDSLRQSVADVFNVSNAELLDDSFILRLMQDGDLDIIAEGGEKAAAAIERLQKDVASDILINIKARFEGTEIADQIQNFIDTQIPKVDLTVGTHIEGTDAFVTELNKIIAAAGMTKEEITSLLGSMGMSAQLHVEYAKTTKKTPMTVTKSELVNTGYDTVDGGPAGMLQVPHLETATYTQVVGYKDIEEVVPVYSIETKSGTSSSGGGIDIIGTTTPPTPSTKETRTGGGGGSTKSNTKSVEEHVDEEHRYDELNKQLEGLSKQYDRLGKARDRAWGKNKIALLGQELDKLKQMQKVYERYLQTVAGDNWKNLHDALQSGGNIGALIAAGRAGGYLQKDFDKLISAAKGGIEYKGKNENGEEQLFHIDWQGLKDTFNIDLLLNEFGDIANKDDIEEAIEAWWNSHMDDINELEDGNEKTRQRAELEAIKDYAKKALDQYADSINTFTENSDKLLDNFYDQQDKFYEDFRYKIDLKVEISERSLKRIEYAIKILGDNIYKVPEVMQAWFDERVKNTKDEVEKMGTTWTKAYEDATAAHDQGLISDEDYIQTIKDAQDGLYGCIDSLLEINDEMREYYKNVLSKVKDEMARITDEMDHQLDTINHLTNVLSLLGRETDYAAIGKILDAQLQMSRNGYDVSKAQVEMYRRQVEAAQAELEQFVMEGISEEALEEWKNAVLYPAQEALREAESEMEADFEQYLEVIKARYENNINRIYQDSERRLTGRWGSFDELNKAMERQHALDEEYLTKTNQIYETNVLLKKLAQDLDKTNNNAAKTRIKNFSSEIEELQQKNKLSKSELEIAKARYEMLLAENALEDARNAKSTVRLQRDNEGNYGYVYTADSDKITAAEDEFEQKRNDLYNLVLGQANDYTEKIIQLNQQAYSELKELDLAYAEGRIADEDTYNRLRQDIIDKYNDLIQEDYESYYRALGWLDVTASTDHTEAWGTSFADILDLEEDFKGETSQVIQETGAEISELSALRAEATEEAKVGNGELEKQLGELTKANNDLAREMIDRVVPSAEETLNMAQQLTAEWIRQYSAIMNLVSGYMALATAMNQTMSDMSGVADEGTGGLGFDPDFDYANAMRNWLLNGGSKDDEQYKQWEREREAKIDSMGLSQDYYGYRGDEFQNKLDTYIENDLEGYTIADAVDAFEQAGENLEQVSEQLNQLTSYGTGGFTGNWGSRGKLAVLHEKELVLNPADTENMLSAVGMLREFSSAIDLRAAASNLSGGLNSPNYEPGAQVVEQEVNIHAEFPNVSNHSEIEEAFNSLINRASQYASRY